MTKLKADLEKNGYPAVRLVWKSKQAQQKPATYYTFQRVSRQAAVEADDEVNEEVETWYVRLITKADFENLLDTTVKNLREAGYIVSSVDQEQYEEATGYWIVPITVKKVKE